MYVMLNIVVTSRDGLSACFLRLQSVLVGRRPKGKGCPKKGQPFCPVGRWRDMLFGASRGRRGAQRLLGGDGQEDKPGGDG